MCFVTVSLTTMWSQPPAKVNGNSGACFESICATPMLHVWSGLPLGPHGATSVSEGPELELYSLFVLGSPTNMVLFRSVICTADASVLSPPLAQCPTVWCGSLGACPSSSPSLPVCTVCTC